MKLTLFSDYSLRILMFAALRDTEQFSVDEVAGIYDLSRHHVAKVVNFLAQHRYLSAQRGRGGGSCLGQKPETIRIGKLVRLTENDSPIVECFDEARNACPLTSACLLKHALGEASSAFYDTLDNYTLADLVRKPNALRQALQMTS